MIVEALVVRGEPRPTSNSGVQQFSTRDENVLSGIVSSSIHQNRGALMFHQLIRTHLRQAPKCKEKGACSDNNIVITIFLEK